MSNRGAAQRPHTASRPLRDTTWMDLARCVDSRIDFQSDSERELLDAKRVCFGCVARIPCLDYALSRRETSGVWGGLLPGEREGL